MRVGVPVGRQRARHIGPRISVPRPATVGRQPGERRAPGASFLFSRLQPIPAVCRRRVAANSIAGTVLGGPLLGVVLEVILLPGLAARRMALRLRRRR